MAQMFIDSGAGWEPLGFTNAEGLEFAPVANEDDELLDFGNLRKSFSLTIPIDPEHADGFAEFFEGVLLEADLAEHDAHEDSLAMESVEEQDLAEEVLYPSA